MEEEIWKDIPGYEGLYQVSNLGRICSLERYVPNYKGKTALLKNKYLKQRLNSQGYDHVNLYKNGICSTKKVHRLVAIEFIPNPDNKPFINHKNGIKSDNRIENLEWCDSSFNIKHAYDTGLNIARFGKENISSKKTIQYSLDYEFIHEFESVLMASKNTGIGATCISAVCRNERKTAGGFIWKYKQ